MKRISRLLMSDKTEKTIHQLYFGKEYTKFVRSFKREKIITFASISIISIAAFVFLTIRQEKELSIPVSEIEREGCTGRDKSLTFRIKTDDYATDMKKTIVVKKKRYSNEELCEYSDSLDEVLWETILGDNKSADCVTSDLELVSEIEGFPFSISWKSDNPMILSSKGEINPDNLSKEPEEEGIVVCLTATLTYEDYRNEKEGFVLVCLPKANEEEVFLKALDDSIEELNKMTESMDSQILPSRVKGKRVYFYKTPEYKGLIILVMGILTAVLAVMTKDKKVEERAQKKKEEMRRDYPEILNKFALYYTAGMNPRSIWNLMSEFYENSPHRKKRYIYEEMLITNRCMQEGQGELSAYDDFAGRCNLSEYRIFINLLQQAVSKGRDDFDRVLYEEMEKANRQETLRVRLTGEEAGTKLLVPMFMMLMIVLVIVMVPAFISFKS